MFSTWKILKKSQLPQLRTACSFVTQVTLLGHFHTLKLFSSIILYILSATVKVLPLAPGAEIAEKDLPDAWEKKQIYICNKRFVWA